MKHKSYVEKEIKPFENPSRNHPFSAVQFVHATSGSLADTTAECL